MWTTQNRRRYDRSKLRYLSDLRHPDQLFPRSRCIHICCGMRALHRAVAGAVQIVWED
jgi:hypothetical protein